MYVTYTSEIFSDPHRKKKVFVEQYLGLFLTELGLFCHFVRGLLAIALGSRLPLFIWIAGIGLGTRLGKLQLAFIRNAESGRFPPQCGRAGDKAQNLETPA